MSILVTGGKGFVGAEVIRRLVGGGHEVICLDLKTTSGRLADVADRITMLGGGVRGPDQLEAVIREHRVDRVAHLVFFAASKDPAAIHAEVATMVMTTADIYESARRTGVDRVVFPSSIHYYGPQWLHGEVPLTEDAPGRASTLYGVSKKLNEATALEYVAKAGMSIVSLRLPAIYGPGAAVGARGVNIAPVQAAIGRPARLPYASSQRVCLGHVGEVADAVVRVLLARAPRHFAYNVGGHTVTYGDIAALVRELVPGADIRFVPRQAPSDLPYLVDDTRLRDEFRIVHRPLREGVRDLIEVTRRTAGLPTSVAHNP